MLTRHTRLRLAREARMDAEGSRGGKVIGHTPSGKPIYESHGHPSHKEFSPEEHKEAYWAHRKEAEKHENSQFDKRGNIRQLDKVFKARKMRDHHHEQARKHKESAGADHLPEV